MINNVLDYLSAAAKAHPNKTAIFESNGNKISFKQLDNLSKKIASYIIGQNVYGKAIAVVATQSIQTIALFFGVVYSGNYFVPLDPDCPQQRLDNILTNAQCSLVLAPQTKLKNFPSQNIVCFDQIVSDANFLVNRRALNNIAQKHSSLDPLYVIYTSGSTGQPKGVIKNHHSMISFVESFCKTFGLNNITMANQSPFYFDASFKDVFLFIKLAATLNLCTKDMFMFPTKLIDFLNAQKVSYICFVPSALSIISALNALKNKTLKYLKYVFFVGEVMPIKHLNYLIDHIGGAKFVNLYGASEMAGVCCYYVVDKKLDLDQNLPIGKPLYNMHVELYDGDQKVRGGGALGEICVISPTLASGYFGDRTKTQTSFVNAPDTPYLHQMYKTGDIAYYDSGGNIVFSCRKDFQIKHMGHRIELFEIEVAANSISQINECACVYDSAKNKIVLYYATAQNQDIALADLINILKQKLPAYMVPTKFIKLEKLPKNSNGKTDRVLLKNML